MERVSTSRIEEMLDYATSYREMDENTPDGTPCQNGGTAMNQSRRESILMLKELLERRADDRT